MTAAETPQRMWLGAALVQARKERGWTQTTLAAELGIHDSLINLWERNRRPVPAVHLAALERLFGVLEGAPALPARTGTHTHGTYAPRTCLWCGERYNPTGKQQRYCGIAHARKAQAARRPRAPQKYRHDQCACGAQKLREAQRCRACAIAKQQADGRERQAARAARQRHRTAQQPAPRRPKPGPLVGKAVYTVRAFEGYQPYRVGRDECRVCLKPILAPGRCWTCATGRVRLLVRPEEAQAAA